MENLFKKMMLPSILSSIVFMILGIIIFMNPEVTLEIIAKVIGFMILGLGIIGIFQYIANRNEASFKLNLLYVLTTVILGGIAIYNYKIVSSILPIVLGIWICFDSFIKLRMSIGIKNMEINNWKYPCVMSILSLAIGIFLLFNPFTGAVVMMKVAAICIVVYSVIDIIQDYAIIRYLK